MYIENLEVLTHVLQASISPVALISGVGLVLLSETNRFTRVTERLRELAYARQEDPEKHPNLNQQIVIFTRRARILRYAIGAALFCILLAAMMVLLIFGIAVLDWGEQRLVVLLFTVSLLSLIASLVLFIWDMGLALKAAEEMLREAAQ